MFPLTIGIFLPGIASDLLVDVSAPSEVSLALETLTDVDAGFDCLFEDSMTVRYLSSLVCFASLLLLAMSWEQFRGREEYEAQEQFWSCFFQFIYFRKICQYQQKLSKPYFCEQRSQGGSSLAGQQ